MNEKYASVKLDHFTRDQGENKECLKPPPSTCMLFNQVIHPFHVGVPKLRQIHTIPTGIRAFVHFLLRFGKL